MRGSRRVLTAVGALVMLIPFAAAEEAEVEPEQLARQAVTAFRKAYRHKDPKVRCDALLELSLTRHELVVREMGKALRKERSPAVAEAAAIVLGDMEEVPDDAGAVLKAQVRVKRNAESAELLRAIANSIGKLRYTGAHDELLWLLEHKNQWVVVAAIQAIGEVGDKKALPELYGMASFAGEYYTQGAREGNDPRSVADAGRDRAAAKVGPGRGRKVHADVVKLYMRHLRETVKKLTGEEFRSLREFKVWLEEHPEEIGRKTGKARRRR